MNQWTDFFTSIVLSALCAATIYQLPLFLVGNANLEESKWIIIAVRILFFTLYPLIPLMLIGGITKFLVEKYELTDDYQYFAYTGASGLVYLAVYFWMWDNMPLYNIAPTLAGTAVFVYLQHREKQTSSKDNSKQE